MPIRAISILGLLWLALCMTGNGCITLPLYGLYPGTIQSGEPGYDPVMMHRFAIALGLVFFALLLYGSLRKSTPAVLAFVAMFTLSSVAVIIRFFSVLGRMH